jgi:hypothetical protein
MSDGFVAHYSAPLSADDLAGSFAAFEAAGLTLENSLTRAATMLDAEGDQVRTDRIGLASAVADAVIGEQVTFQLWISDSVDVICSYRALTNQLAVRRYLLDGLLPDEAELAIAAVGSQLGLVSPKTVAFVVDRRGVSAETDLDALVREGAESHEELLVDVFLHM